MFASHASLKLTLPCFLFILGVGAALPIWTELDLDPPPPEAVGFSCPPTKQRALWHVFFPMQGLIRKANTAGEVRGLEFFYLPDLIQGALLVVFAAFVSAGVYFLSRKLGQKKCTTSPAP